MPLNHSNSDTRSFSNRRTKFTAAHIRKLISTGDLLHFNSITPTPIDQPKGHNVETIQKSHKLHLSALAEPLDIEDILSNSTVSHPTTDNVSSSILFPPVDLELHPLPLTTLTVPSPIIPNDIDPYTIEPHIMDILERYSENSSKSFIISRKHQLYSSGYGCQKAVITQKKYLDKVCKQSFEEMQSAVSDLIGNSGVSLFGDERDSYCSISSDSASIVSSTKEDTISGNGNTISSASQNSLAKDAIFPHLIGRTTPAALQIENSIKRNASKLPNLVSLLPISEEDKNEFNIEHRNIPNTSSCATSDLKPFLLFKVQELSFDPADLEPIFASITLFDLKEKRRLSESFYFDFNATHLNAMIQQSLFASGLLPKAALFQIQNFELLSDIFVVIKLEKVLQAGEANDIYEPYVKDHSSSGIKEKHQNFMIDNCKRLSNYRMPFAWTAIELSQVLQNGTNTNTLSHKKDNSYLGNNGDKYFDDSANIYSNDSSLIEETESILSMDHPTSLISPSQFCTLTKNKRTSNINSEPLTSPPVTPRKVSSLESNKPPNQRQQFQSISNKPIIVKLHSFFRAELDKLSDEEIIKMLFENRKNSAKLSKMKSINSKFIIEITLLPPDWNQLDETNAYLINNCISSELKRWKNSIAMFNNYNSNPILREVLSFPAKGQYEVNDSTNLRNLLFIYPKMANFSNKSGNARNISIRIELMDSHEKPCKALYSRNSNQLVDKIYTSVSYHTKYPQFSDEIKINIPANLNDGYHILFTFCHISCKLNKHNDGVETEIAYTWLPLYQEKGCLQTGNNFHIPISLEPLPKGYCYLSPDVNLPNIKWLEAHKPLFQVSMSAITTIHTEDKYLDAFLRVYHSLDTTDTNDILNAVKNVTKSQPQPMVSFMYIIFDKLLSLITYSKISHKLSECRLAETCFTTLSQLIKICTVLLDVSTLDGHGRSSFLIKYIHLNKITTKSPFDNDTFNDSLKYGLSGDTTYDDLNKIIKKVEASNSMKNSTYSKSCGYTKFLHEELVQQWTYATGSLKDMSCTYSWFYLELIIKSMGELLLNQNSQMLYISRRTRFSDSYLGDLCRLQTLLTNEIIEKSSKDHNTARQINNAFAFFLQDSFSIMDRTFVMRLVKGYYNDIGIKISMYGDNLSRNLMLLRLEFTKILLSHEHIIALNLPMSHQYLCNYYDLTQPTNESFDTSSLLCSLPQVENKYASISSSPNTFTLSRTKSSVFPDELSNAFKAQHFLIGVLLSDLVTSIHSNNGSIQNQAITNLKNLLVSHENDVRICNDKSLMERVAELYFPLLGKF
uniref:C2 DOCK-type domain-containing protein n=1 Tax=Rhabditophanes sp. KR3021 TaxID=114890 RepID=A0AC35U1K6_9BILA